MNIVKFDPTTSGAMIDSFMPGLVELLTQESPDIAASDIDTAYVKKLLLAKSIVAFLALEGDALIGCALIGFGPAWYNPKKLSVKDLLVWTSPEHRGEGVATRLIAAVENYAKQNGYQRVYLSQSTGIGVENTANLYQKLGYTLSGFMSSKRMN
jgi:GNAT superfamily N-acetyltransferase